MRDALALSLFNKSEADELVRDFEAFHATRHTITKESKKHVSHLIHKSNQPQQMKIDETPRDHSSNADYDGEAVAAVAYH